MIEDTTAVRRNRNEAMAELRSAVIVFGESLVDWFGDHAIPGGAPFNVARHLAGLGLDPLLITRVGDDADGRRLRAELERFGVRGEGIQVDPALPTGRVVVREGNAGHEFEIVPDQAYDRIETGALCARLRVPAGGAPWLYFGTLAQRAAGNRAALAQLREALPHRVFVDLNWRAGQVAPAIAQSALASADVLKVSAEELALLLGWAGLRPDPARRVPPPGTECPAIAGLLHGRRVVQLLVTHGAAGYALWDAGGVCRAAGAAAAVPAMVDTVGAGDAFAAIALAGRMLDWPLQTALVRANAFAAAICAVRGAVPDDPAFYAPWRRQWNVPARESASPCPNPSRD
jgi:fructokinase